MVRECVKTCYLKCETCFVAWYVMNFLFACSWKECVGTLSLLPYFLITTYLVFLLIVYYFKKLSAVALPSKTKWAFSPIPWSLSSLSALKLCNDWPLSPHDSTLKLSRFFKHSNMQLTSYKFHSSPLLIIKLIINLGSSFLTDKMFEILPWSSFISFLPKPGCSLKSSGAVFSNKLSSAPPLEISGSEN